MSSRRHKDRLAGKPPKPKYSPYSKLQKNTALAVSVLKVLVTEGPRHGMTNWKYYTEGQWGWEFPLAPDFLAGAQPVLWVC